MKRMIVTALSLSLFSMAFFGCAEKSATKTETKVTTPTGSKTVTSETEVKETGSARTDKTP